MMKNLFFCEIQAEPLQIDLFKEMLRTSSIKTVEKEVYDIVQGVIDKVEMHRAVVWRLNSNLANVFNEIEIHKLSALLGPFFGRLLGQNENGDEVITVYDRDRLGSLFRGARYHQTREGGSIHTDNVNVPEKWDYLYLSCISSALVGGESIFVDGFLINEILEKKYSNAYSILKEPFIWEMRGVKDELYLAPIISFDEKGEPHFRHLRPYMESAHEKAKKPLTSEQLYALDILDALLNESENQVRYKMKCGDILISKDDQVLHGRTCFSDELGAVSINESSQYPNKPLKRTMDRLWIRK